MEEEEDTRREEVALLAEEGTNNNNNTTRDNTTPADHDRIRAEEGEEGRWKRSEEQKKKRGRG